MSRIGYKPEDGTNGKFITMLKKELHELRTQINNIQKSIEKIEKNPTNNRLIENHEVRLDTIDLQITALQNDMSSHSH
mgnify:CR=1 FL=1